MREVSILVGGKAGEGIKFAAQVICEIFNNLGYYSFGYIDYPSLIKGGHNFAVIRASERKIYSHREKVDAIIALDKNTVEKHKDKLKDDGIIIFDKSFECEGIGIEASEIIKELNLPEISKNMVLIGAFAKAFGIPFEILENVIRECCKRNVEENLKAAKEGYERVNEIRKAEKIGEKKGKIITGNEATAIGLVKGGLNVYIAYPMTPSTSILHFLAKNQDKFGIKVIHPENEIAVINMALGCAYAGKRAAVGTSGGGFALMVEALSLAGMSETPILIVEAQRGAPSTGVPTYTMQGDLLFVTFAGHGDFPRIVVAPGDADEAFHLAREGLNLAWKFQVPVLFLSDKHLAEDLYTATFKEEEKIVEPKLWDGKGEYKRYKITEDGVSPLAFPGDPRAIVKASSYEHDEFGITVEDAEKVRIMQEKRWRKRETIIEYLKKEKTVNVGGNPDSDIVLITWGSTKGVVFEVAEELGIKAVQPMYLEPLPTWELEKELKNASKIIDVELNISGQFAKLLRMNGIEVDEKILKYDARPFTFDELLRKVKEVI